MPYPTDVNAPMAVLPPDGGSDLPPMGNEPVELPASFVSQAGRPGVGVVGSHAYRVGVQQWTPEQAAAFATRQAVLEAQRNAAFEAQQDAVLKQSLDAHLRVEGASKGIQAAYQFLAQRQLTRRSRELVAGGMPPAQAAAIGLAENPGAVTPGLASFARAGATPPAPPLGSVTALTIPGTTNVFGYGTRTSAGGMHVTPAIHPDEVRATTRLAALKADDVSLRTELANDMAFQRLMVKDPTAAKQDPRLRQLESIRGEYRKLQGTGGPAIKPPPGAVAPLPAPPKAQRKTGQVYMTGSGPAKWMGNGWILEQ